MGCASSVPQNQMPPVTPLMLAPGTEFPEDPTTPVLPPPSPDDVIPLSGSSDSIGSNGSHSSFSMESLSREGSEVSDAESGAAGTAAASFAVSPRFRPRHVLASGTSRSPRHVRLPHIQRPHTSPEARRSIPTEKSPRPTLPHTHPSALRRHLTHPTEGHPSETREHLPPPLATLSDLSGWRDIKLTYRVRVPRAF